MVTLSLLAALGTSVCYGVGSVLQAIGSRRAAEPDAEGAVRGLVHGLARQLPFLAGLGLDGAGLLLSVYALQELPLFVVQAAVASSVAITALTARVVLDARLGRRDGYAIVGVMVGLALLGAAAGSERPVDTSPAFRVGLLGVGATIAVAAWIVLRREVPGSAPLLGSLAGLAYGVGAVAIRVTVSFAPSDLLANPATPAAVVGAATGVLTYASALQRGSVTATTGALTAAETVLPALVGLVVLDERPKAGWWPIAVVGFALSVAGAVSLSRFGEAASEEPEIELTRPVRGTR